MRWTPLVALFYNEGTEEEDSLDTLWVTVKQFTPGHAHFRPRLVSCTLCCLILSGSSLGWFGFLGGRQF